MPIEVARSTTEDSPPGKSAESQAAAAEFPLLDEPPPLDWDLEEMFGPVATVAN